MQLHMHWYKKKKKKGKKMFLEYNKKAHFSYLVSKTLMDMSVDKIF